MEITTHEMLVHIPLVKEDAPKWKKICPFCGAYDLVHELDGFYVCHECHANWIENDTDTERQIQVLNLNGGTLPKPGEGKMPIVFREIERFTHGAEISFENETVTFRNSDGKIYAVRSLHEWISDLYGEGRKHHAEYACA